MSRTATFTFLFADIEGSTALLQALEGDYAAVLDGYRAIVREALAQHEGREVGTEGDGFFAVFESSRLALLAAAQAQRELARREWPRGISVQARMGLHTGEATEGTDGFVGIDVHRAARIAAAARGGETLLSDTTRVIGRVGLHDLEFADLGRHRLRDLTEPEHLWRLTGPGLRDDFPPPRTLDAVPNNLPTQLTSFVGRDDHVDRIRMLLAENRLVTLTGPGGTGKTRLALQVAACMTDEFPDGVWFVPLAPVRDPGLVASAILEALALREAADRTPADRLLDHLATMELLLLLDNFEQLLAASGLAADILRAAPSVRVLVTSRAALHVSGEQEYPVPPLGVPPTHGISAEALSQYEAVALFIQRASAVRPGFTVTNANAPAVAEICARLDGLPLAIELAAARVKLLTPEAMLQRLDNRLGLLAGGPRDLPARQQRLRDTIAWSYDLLEDQARLLMDELSVFVGGSDLDAVQAICADDLDDDVLDVLSTLVDHSLVRQREHGGRVRFLMLETIREFASERLALRGNAHPIHLRHAQHYLELSEAAAPHLTGPDQAVETRRVMADLDNWRAAVDWFGSTGDVAAVLRMNAALWRIWQKTHVREGRMRLAAALELPGADDDPKLLSAALEAAGGLAYWAGDVDDARIHYERALAIERTLDRPGGIANALYNLSFTYFIPKDRAGQGLAMLEEALARYEADGDEEGRAKVVWGLAAHAYMNEHYERTLELSERALELARERGDMFLTGWSLHLLGVAQTRKGDLAAARDTLVEALRMFADVGDLAAVTMLLDDFAELACTADRPERQATLSAASRVLQTASGSELTRLAMGIMGRTEVDRHRLGAAWDRGLRMSTEEAVAYALSDVD